MTTEKLENIQEAKLRLQRKSHKRDDEEPAVPKICFFVVHSDFRFDVCSDR
jgi:hypothetical protein